MRAIIMVCMALAGHAAAQSPIMIAPDVAKTFTARAASATAESADSNAVTLAASRNCTPAAPCIFVTDAVDPAVTVCRFFESGTQVGADQPLAAGACRFTLIRGLPPPTNFRIIP